MHIQYRPMVRRDALYAAQLDADSIDGWQLRDYLRALKSKCFKCSVAEYDGLVVGLIAFSSNPLIGTIERLIVSAQYRRNGIGSCLLSIAENTLEHRQARMEVDEEDVEMQSFLKSRGYVCYKTYKTSGFLRLKFSRGQPVAIPKGTYGRFFESMH